MARYRRPPAALHWSYRRPWLFAAWCAVLLSVFLAASIGAAWLGMAIRHWPVAW
jgi:hypothetical protein